MDLFRLFDRSGRGTVYIEEFVTGLVEKLNSLQTNTELISSIVDELLALETRPGELANKLEKLNQNFEKLPVFRVNFRALTYSLISALKLCYQRSQEKSSSSVTVLTKPYLTRFFIATYLH